MCIQGRIFFKESAHITRDIEEKKEIEELSTFSNDTVIQDLLSFQVPLLSFFSDRLSSSSLQTIKRAARLLEWLQWNPTGTEATIRYYIGTGRWDKLSQYDSLGVETLFNLIISEDNWTEPDLFTALSTFEDKTVFSVLQRVLATPEGAARLVKAFAHISDTKKYLFLLQIIIRKDFETHGECIRSIKNSDINWIPWLTMHLNSDDYEEIRTVSHLLDELDWYPVGDGYRIRYYIGTSRWDELIQTGSPGCSIFLRLKGCRDEKRIHSFISILQKFSTQEVIHSLSSLSDEELNTVIPTLTSVTDGDDISYILALLSDKDHEDHQVLIERLESWRSLIISFVEPLLSSVEPDSLPAVSHLLQDLSWYPIGDNAILYWAGRNQWKEMLRYLPMAQDTIHPAINEWISSFLPQSGFVGLHDLASVLSHTGWYPIGYANRLSYAIGQYDWEMVGSYGPAAIQPLIAYISDARGEVCTEIIRVITESGPVHLASVFGKLIKDDKKILPFLTVLYDNAEFLKREPVITDTLLSAFLSVLTQNDSSESFRNLIKQVRQPLISLLQALLPALSYHNLVTSCSLLDRLTWYPAGKELAIRYYIGKNDWDSIRRFGSGGIAALLAFADKKENSHDFPYGKALSRCNPTEILYILRSYRIDPVKPDYIPTFLLKLTHLTDPADCSFFLKLLETANKEHFRIPDLLTDAEKDILASRLFDLMKTVPYPELCSLCITLTRLNRVPADHDDYLLFRIGLKKSSDISAFNRPAIIHLLRLIAISPAYKTGDLIRMVSRFDEKTFLSAFIQMATDKNTGTDLVRAFTRVRDQDTTRFWLDSLYNGKDMQDLLDTLMAHRTRIVQWLSNQLLSHDDNVVIRSAELLEKLDWYPVGTDTRLMYYVVTQDWNSLNGFPLSLRTDRPRLISLVSRTLSSAPYDELLPITTVLDKLGWKPTGNEERILFYFSSLDHEGIVQAGSAATIPLMHLMMRSRPNTDLITMAGLTNDPRVVPLLVKALADPNPVLSVEAEQVLRSMDRLTLERGLEILCTDPEGTFAEYLSLVTRKGSVSLLVSLMSGSILSGMDSDLKKAVSAWLSDQLDTVFYSDLAPIAQVLDSLGFIPDGHQYEVYYWMGKRDWDQVWGLSSNDVTPLTVALRHETREHCYAIIRILGHIASTESTDALISCLYYKDPGIRKEATHALTRIHDARKICPLVHVLTDQDYEVRKEALDAIMKYGQSYGTGEVVKCLISQVTSVYTGSKKAYTPVIRSIIDIDDPDPVRYFLSVFSDTSISLHDDLFDIALIEYKVQICDWLSKIATDPRYDIMQIQAIQKRLGCRY